MTVEIRELVIKTEITTRPAKQAQKLSHSDIRALKRQIINECRRILVDRSAENNGFNR